jgi:hypothetical protein
MEKRAMSFAQHKEPTYFPATAQSQWKWGSRSRPLGTAGPEAVAGSAGSGLRPSASSPAVPSVHRLLGICQNIRPIPAHSYRRC